MRTTEQKQRERAGTAPLLVARSPCRNPVPSSSSSISPPLSPACMRASVGTAQRTSTGGAGARAAQQLSEEERAEVEDCAPALMGDADDGGSALGGRMESVTHRDPSQTTRSPCLTRPAARPVRAARALPVASQPSVITIIITTRVRPPTTRPDSSAVSCRRCARQGGAQSGRERRGTGTGGCCRAEKVGWPPGQHESVVGPSVCRRARAAGWPPGQRELPRPRRVTRPPAPRCCCLSSERAVRTASSARRVMGVGWGGRCHDRVCCKPA